MITVVCRHNQARSVLAAAALRRFFPTLEVASAGIEGVEGQRIPQSILNLADAWGLDVLDVVSHSLEAVQDKLLRSSLVIVAEDEFIPHIVAFGIAPERVLSMQDRRLDHAVIPFDPIGQGERVLSVELSKAIMTSVQLLRAERGFGRSFPVEAIFPLDEVDFQNKLRKVWENLSGTNGILLLGDFRAPDIRAVSQVCTRILELRVDRLDPSIDFFEGTENLDIHQILASSGPIAIAGRYEMDQVEKFALSTQFTSLIDKLGSIRPVKILTEPMGFGPCAYLVAANGNIG